MAPNETSSWNATTDSNSSSPGPVCPMLEQHGWTMTYPAAYYSFYSTVALVAIVGNSAILAVTRSHPEVIQRRTYRLLTQAMSVCELVLACDLIAMMFRNGVGYWNRTGRSVGQAMLVSDAWDAEAENQFYHRGLTMLKLVLSIRDVSIACEVFFYALLAWDRVLAIAQPLSTVWSHRLVGAIVSFGVVTMATVETSLQSWLLTAVAAADRAGDELRVCDLLVRVVANNVVAKSGAMVSFYLLSLAAYLATACLLLKRCWKTHRATQAAQTQRDKMQLGKPMAALVAGNLLHFISILPLAIHSSGLAKVDWIAFDAFFCNCAVIPCLAIAFNAAMRQQLRRMLTASRCKR